MKEGVIKFRCKLADGVPPAEGLIRELNEWRTRLFSLDYIGEYPDGISYGNMSVRLKDNQFIITGSQTGGLLELTPFYYTTVTDFSVHKNIIKCRGRVKASSESLTHAMIYSLLPGINSVFHIHSPELWKKLLNKIPTTKKDVEYGTPEMALEIERLLKETNLRETQMFVMAGHEDGLASFGKSPDEAGELLLSC